MTKGDEEAISLMSAIQTDFLVFVELFSEEAQLALRYRDLLVETQRWVNKKLFEAKSSEWFGKTKQCVTCVYQNTKRKGKKVSMARLQLAHFVHKCWLSIRSDSRG